MFKLSFEYKFKHTEDKVYFAASVPYTYSTLSNHLDKLKSLQAENESGKVCEIDEITKSLGGLGVPIVTVTNFEKNHYYTRIEKNGREHPVLGKGLA